MPRREVHLRVLLGLDLKLSGHAWLLERAAWVARAEAAQVDLLFVATTEREVPEARQQLARFLESLPEDLRGEALVEVGSPVDRLIEHTKGENLLLVGPREPGALERMFLGSMASRVIRAARGAVLVPRRPQLPSARPKMLVAIDLRRGEGGDLLQLALPWAQRFGAVVDAIYVDPLTLPRIPDASVRARAQAEWDASRKLDREVLRALLAKLPDENRGEAHLAEGEPDAVLVERSAEYELLLMGNRQRLGITGYLMGSVAEHVVRNATCDVLTVSTQVQPKA